MARKRAATSGEGEANAAPAATPGDVARAVFEALGTKELERAGELMHEDAVDDFVAVGVYRGRDAILGFFRELFAAFPDFQLRVERVVADQATAVVQWDASGTFTGTPFLGIEATGRWASIRGVDVMEVEDGKVRRNTIYYDGAEFARGVGMLPRRGSAADRAMLAAFNTSTRLRARLKR